MMRFNLQENVTRKSSGQLLFIFIISKTLRSSGLMIIFNPLRFWREETRDEENKKWQIY